MGNFWKYNDKVGAGVSGLTTANNGDAIADNEIIRGDGTTGIQGGVLTSADHNGDIAGPTTGSDTTAVGIAYPAQPLGDSVQILSSDAGDVAVDITIIGTTTGTDTVVVEVLATDATDGTTPVTSVKADWGQILAVKKAVTTGTITIQKTTGPATVTTLLAAATSSGVAAATNTANAWNRLLKLVGSGATTKQVGVKGTNSAGATIYDSQALAGTTTVYSNSAFVEVHEFYIGDLEATRTLTASTQGGVGVATITGTSANGDVTIDPQGTGKLVVDNLSITGNTIASTDTNGNINLDPNGNGTTGTGYVSIHGFTAGISAEANTGLYLVSNGVPVLEMYNAVNPMIRSDGQYCIATSTGVAGATTPDTGLARSAAGVMKVTDGSTGLGSVVASTVKVGGTTSSFPMLSNDSANIKARKADDSDWVLLKSLGQDVYSSGTTNRLIVLYATSPYEVIGLASGVPLGWSSSATDGGTPDTKMVRVAAGQVGIGNATNGQLTNLKTSATTVNLTGATTTATGLFPAKCIQLGVTVRVTTLITSGDGGTSMNIGDGTDPDRYGATIAFAAGTTVTLSDATADPRGWAAAAGDVVFTCVGGTFNAGVARVVAHYIDLTAPTS